MGGKKGAGKNAGKTGKIRKVRTRQRLLTVLTVISHMDLWHVKCSNCGYEARLNLGSTDPGQTYTDLNEDFAYYKLFLCKKEKAFLPVNIHDRNFDNRCPADGSELFPAEVPPARCPKCNARITPKRLDINEMLG